MHFPFVTILIFEPYEEIDFFIYIYNINIFILYIYIYIYILLLLHKLTEVWNFSESYFSTWLMIGAQESQKWCNSWRKVFPGSSELERTYLLRIPIDHEYLPHHRDFFCLVLFVFVSYLFSWAFSPWGQGLSLVHCPEYSHVCVCVCFSELFSCDRLFVTRWAIAH